MKRRLEGYSVEDHHRSSNALAMEGLRGVDEEEVSSFKSPECFYLSDDPISSRLAFFLSSILLTIYGRTPDVLVESFREKLGLEPVKFNLENPVELGFVFYYRRVLLAVCSACPVRGECPWRHVLTSLRKLRVGQ